MSEEGRRALPWEPAHRVLQAVAIEAYGRPGAYVTRDLGMKRSNMANTKHFRTIARYLEEQGRVDSRGRLRRLRRDYLWHRRGDQVTKRDNE